MAQPGGGTERELFVLWGQTATAWLWLHLTSDLAQSHTKSLYSGRPNRPTRALYRGSDRIGSNEG